MGVSNVISVNERVLPDAPPVLRLDAASAATFQRSSCKALPPVPLSPFAWYPLLCPVLDPPTLFPSSVAAAASAAPTNINVKHKEKSQYAGNCFLRFKTMNLRIAHTDIQI